MTNISIVQGDITKTAVDAVVNAANAYLLPGGGVCGAIFRTAGPALVKSCEAIGWCPTGEAVLTPAFDMLNTKYVIHAVGPIWHDDRASLCDRQLYSAYRCSLTLAKNAGLSTIAFPAISMGIYGYPIDRGAKIAMLALRDHGTDLELIRVVCFEDVIYQAFGRYL